MAQQATDYMSNLVHQANAQPKQADNDDLSDFTDERDGEKAQSNNVPVIKAVTASPPKVCKSK